MRRSTLAFAILLLSGCAAPQQLATTPVEDTEVFVASYDAVWGAVVATLAAEHYPIKAIEKESGLIATEFVTFTTSSLRAKEEIDGIAVRPGVFLGTWSQGRYSLTVFVARLADSTTSVKVTPHIEGFEDNVTRRWHVCPSLGVVESAVFDSVRARL